MGDRLVHDVQERLDKVSRLRQRARARRRATSVPLLVFGGITLVGAGLPEAGLGFSGVWSLYWIVAGPLGFWTVHRYQQRRLRRTGVGSGRGSYAAVSVALVAAAVLLGGLFLLFGGVLVAIGLGLLVLALRQGNRPLALAATAYGIVGGLEGFHLISNRIMALSYELGLNQSTSGYFPEARPLVIAVLGVVTLAGGALAARWERQVS